MCGMRGERVCGCGWRVHMKDAILAEALALHVTLYNILTPTLTHSHPPTLTHSHPHPLPPSHDPTLTHILNDGCITLPHFTRTVQLHRSTHVLKHTASATRPSTGTTVTAVVCRGNRETLSAVRTHPGTAVQCDCVGRVRLCVCGGRVFVCTCVCVK